MLHSAGNYGKLGHGDSTTQKAPKLIAAFAGKVRCDTYGSYVRRLFCPSQVNMANLAMATYKSPKLIEAFSGKVVLYAATCVCECIEWAWCVCVCIGASTVMLFVFTLQLKFHIEMVKQWYVQLSVSFADY